MDFQIVETSSTASTNADLAAAAQAGAPEGTVHVTAHQTAGRGRLDRSWEAPPGSGVTASILLRPSAVPDHLWTWLPLLTGVAVAEAVVALGADVRLKWPNDVLAADRKLAGILVERIETPDGPAAVVGVGINVAMTDAQLPVPDATSLALLGIVTDATTVLDLVLGRLADLYEAWVAASGDPGHGLREAYRARSGTLGEHVRVTMADGSTFDGHATDVDEAGRLIVDGRPVSAGDVAHVRR